MRVAGRTDDVLVRTTNVLPDMPGGYRFDRSNRGFWRKARATEGAVASRATGILGCMYRRSGKVQVTFLKTAFPAAVANRA